MTDKETIQTIYQRLAPAKQTIEYMRKNDENMNNLNTNFQLMQKDIKVICEKLEENTAEHTRMFERIDKFIESADDKYTKYTEFSFWRTVLISGILLTIFIMVVAAFFGKIFN